MTPTLISVVIPAYNAERYLPAALESVLAQHYRPLEVIVVDDGSDRPCAELCSPFPAVRCIAQANGGPAAAMNTGLAHAAGAFVAFHDSDDLMVEGKLEAQMHALTVEPELGFVSTRLENFLEPGVASPAWFEEEAKLTLRMGFVDTALIRRDVFRTVGLFDTAYRIGQDIDWLVRARDAGIRSCVLPTAYTRRRIHERNISADVATGHANLLEIIHASVVRRAATVRTEGGPH